MVSAVQRGESIDKILSVLALSSRFDGQNGWPTGVLATGNFQYSLCRVVLMVNRPARMGSHHMRLSVLALSSRFDGHVLQRLAFFAHVLSVLALSSRFDGLAGGFPIPLKPGTFSTRSVESF